MNYAEQQRNPGRHAVGITVVVLLHVLIVYALVTGLARTVIEVVKGPIDVKVIEEVIKKPPPPPDVVPPPPKMAAPPPPFIPPPEINIAPPPTPAPAISAITQEAPPAPQAPVIQKAPPAPPPAPAVQSARVVCPNYTQVMSSISYPREAIKDNREGEVVIEFTITASGEVKDAEIKSTSHRVFNRASLSVISDLKCKGQGRDIRAQAPISFKLR
jgi:protein TonB